MDASASRRVPLAASGRVVFVAADMAGLAVFSPLGLLRQLAPTFIGSGLRPGQERRRGGCDLPLHSVFWAVLAFPIPRSAPGARCPSPASGRACWFMRP
jgi:hypothetical protein